MRELRAYCEREGLSDLSEITLEHLDAFRTGRKLGPLATLRELGRLRYFFKFCLKRKWITDNPAADSEAPRNIRPPEVVPRAAPKPRGRDSMSNAGSTGLPDLAVGPPQIQVFGAPEQQCPDSSIAQLDAPIQADAERRKNRPQPKRSRRRRSDPGIPSPVRKKITRLARELNRQQRQSFITDPKLKDRAARLLRSLLPPKPRRRGRPGRTDVTQALRLLKRFKPQYPEEKPVNLWARVYPIVIPGYGAMNQQEKRHAKAELRERVRWRKRSRQRTRNRANTEFGCRPF